MAKRYKGCIACHALTLELDENGRCMGCAAAKAASDAGMTYGKYISARDAGRFIPSPPPVVEEIEVPEQKGKPPKRKCEWCGELFNPRGTTARYCSDKCRVPAHRKMAKERYREKMGQNGPRFCAVCGKEIPWEVTALQKTCSLECREEYNHAKRRKDAARNRAKRKAAENG